jgi:hypothetical protein
MRMNRLHPNLLPARLALLCALTVVGGCSHNQTGINNPFLAPDRVAPPSTRAIAPGTAQPYYPGDPLPVMQSAAPTAAPATNFAAAVPRATSPIAPEVVAEPKKIASSNEPTVAVPSDDSSLRFELPKPPEPAPAPAAPIVDARSAPPGAVANPNFAGAPATAQPPTNVVPAIYNSPLNSQQFNQVSSTATLAEPAIGTPWRSPQIPASAPPPAYFPGTQPNAAPLVAQPTIMPGYVVVPQMTAVPQNMDVSLRAVPSPSPPPTPVEPSTPRIRLPGYPAPPGSMTPVPPISYGASSDGFRPRSSMR